MRKFSISQVCYIRNAVNMQNTPATEIAKKMNSSASSIRRVANGTSYASVPMPKAIPGFSNYLAYPDGRVWSCQRRQFIKPARKSSTAATRYYNLHSSSNRASIRSDRLAQLVF